MEESSFWIIAIIAAVVLVVIIALIVELGRPDVEVIINDGGRNNPGGSQRIAQRHEICNTDICAPGLICTSISGQSDRRCLSALDQTCLVDQDCASGFCQRKTQGQNGVCRNPGTMPMPTPMPTPSGATQIYCRQGESWVARITIPMGLVFNRITSSNGRLLGISTQTNQIYLWTGSSWQNISTSFTAPGTLVDGVIVGNDIWLVYRLSSGQTALYRLSNNVLTPINTSTGGLQTIATGQVIDIQEIAIHPNGDIFLVGRTNGGQVTIYRKAATATFYTPVTVGQHIFVVDTRNADNFAFTSGSSILFLGDNATRQDNIVGPVTDLVVTADNQIWYIAGNQLFRNGQQIATPVTINATTRLFYSTTEGVCFFTPGL